MEQFKTKFVYPIFFFFLLMFLFWFCVFLTMVSLGIYHLSIGKSINDNLKLLLGVFFLFGFFCLMCGHMTLLLRYGLIMADKKIILINYLFWRRIDITNSIQGYSRTDFGSRGTSKKTLILYLNDGRKINMPKFMYFNFSEIETHFIDNKIKFLGEEPYKWKNLIQRKYQY
ncbi:MAG: hypothetical protein QM726_11065 [Chitinophagaceae bacterium]